MAKRSTASTGKDTPGNPQATKGNKQRNTSGSRGSHPNSRKNLEGKTFKDKPERINMKGRPPKLLHEVTADLKAKGYTPVTESQLIEAYETLLQLPRAEVKKIAEDKEKPYFLTLVAKWIGQNNGMQMLDRVMDRAFGKVMQRQQLDATVTSVPDPEASTPDHAAILKSVQARLDEIDKK